MKNGGSVPDAFWHHRSDGSTDEACSGVLGFGIGPREGVLLWANLGLAIVTNGTYFSSDAALFPNIFRQTCF